MQNSTNSISLDSLNLLNALLASTNFRKKLPDVLQGFAKMTGTDRTILMEVLPNRLNALEFECQRLVEVCHTGQLKEHQLPPALADQYFEFKPLFSWLFNLNTADSELTKPADKTPMVIQANAKTDEAFKMFHEEKTCSSMVSFLEVEFSAFLLFPLIHENRLWGFVFTCSSVERQWSQATLEFGKTLTKLLARLLSDDHHDNQGLIDQNRTTSESSFNLYPASKYVPPIADKMSSLSEHDFVRTLATTVPDCLFVIDLETAKLVYCSKETYLGYDFLASDSPLELFARIIHPDQRSTGIHNFFQRFREAKDDEVVESEYRIRHRDGHWVWVQERVRVFQRFPSGRVKQYLSMMVDITEKKLNAIRLKKSQERYHNFIKYSAEGIYFMNCGVPISIHLPPDEQTKIYYQNAFIDECNEALVEMYGMSKQEDLMGKRIEEMHQGENYEQNQESFQVFIENGYKVENVETREQDASGIWHYFANQAVGIIEEDHLVGIWGVQRDITETRKAEMALRESELKLSAFVEDVQLGIWEWDWEEDRIAVNDIFLDVLELPDSKKAFTQKEFIALIAEPYRKALAVATRYHLDNQTANYQVDIQMGASAETMRWVQLHGRLVEKDANGEPKRLIGNLTNIHDSKLANLRIKEGEALLEAVVHAIPDTKFRVGSDGVILSVYTTDQEQANPAFRHQQVIGKKLDQIFPLAIAKGLEFNAAKALRTKTLQTFEFVDDGEEPATKRYYEARINAIDEEAFILILRDVSAIKTTEQALTEQIHEVDRKNRELETYIKSNLQLENFAYIASHDLREPVRTMRTFSQFLKKRAGDQLDKDSKMYLDFIISGANRMNQLIQDLLTYSRVNTEPFESETIELGGLLNRVQENLKGSIEEKKADIQIEKLPQHIQGSGIRLEQLFQNLISNAVKFHQEGIPPNVNISATDVGSHWQFTVADNGIGIDPEFHEQVFVIFKKLHNNQAYQGTGIGLALVKRIVTQHRGEVWLDSALDEGTRIHFTLHK